MFTKIALISAAVALVLVGVQTWRLGLAQEELGATTVALKQKEATEKARVEKQTLVEQLKDIISTDRKESDRANRARYNRILEELSNVETNACFRDRTAIPREYVRVLNGGSDSAPTTE